MWCRSALFSGLPGPPKYPLIEPICLGKVQGFGSELTLCGLQPRQLIRSPSGRDVPEEGAPATFVSRGGGVRLEMLAGLSLSKAAML